MGKAIEYKFFPEASVDSTQTCPIEITSGQFAGIGYRYGKIDFKEDGIRKKEASTFFCTTPPKQEPNNMKTGKRWSLG